MNWLNQVTEFRDHFKFRIDQLICQLCSIPVLMRDEAEKGRSLCRHLSIRFFVANNQDLIYNYAPNTVINYDYVDCTV